ncbi:LytTR family DNA-binding domain-containing protein [Cognatishimia sp. SS12]|nr:LytTR family DNA-binding domain-containing protein [Cognatishimia sp. SS12]
MAFAPRALYWLIIVSSSIVLGYFGHALARLVAGPDETAVVQLLSGAFGTVFVATDVWLVRHLFQTSEGAQMGYQALLGNVGFVFFAVVAVRIGIMQVHRAQGHDTEPEKMAPSMREAPEEDAPAATPRLMQRLPAHIGGQILRLTADNHFVEVVSTQGATSLRMRFRDAIAELDGIAGSVVHRSHWVAHDAISGVDKTHGKLVLRLRNGDEVPVSRSYRAELEAADLPMLPFATEISSEVSDRS